MARTENGAEMSLLEFCCCHVQLMALKLSGQKHDDLDKKLTSYIGCAVTILGFNNLLQDQQQRRYPKSEY
ncbi:uncharacterized protein M6B38_376850 [Iris pallida]|uniref:Uncharacterized protein n=1 Tax=Iris pallida TaxID=29817 RepID=A0AAX6GA98_IRIPA|nr:uncharacterized protein M6B38_376850 [Iris pallida]